MYRVQYQPIDGASLDSTPLALLVMWMLIRPREHVEISIPFTPRMEHLSDGHSLLANQETLAASFYVWFLTQAMEMSPRRVPAFPAKWECEQQIPEGCSGVSRKATNPAIVVTNLRNVHLNGSDVQKPPTLTILKIECEDTLSFKTDGTE